MVAHMRSKDCDRLVLFSCGEQHHSQASLRSDNMIVDLKAFKEQADKFQF